ncbi:hypothetical protein NIES2119_31660 [[Phormidium ambiguum] IAM M-71]|uniref:Uncharacterized protein n=1 Tax=[Phormidium ambiguum] IAM M-71 TaxID=454136 RepID=A0A1U7I1V4_9CYAN|nr:hypothetical protein [Phormidium ambiguum]OKH30034.1 hypothetical protein NIES2119_31660 [Phormidium ambiguum IAM M-71]
MDKPILLIGLGITACAVIIAYNAGLATQNISHSQRINELNSEIKKRDELISKKEQEVQNHKTFIRRKDTAARRFVDEYFKGEKK